LWLWIGEQVKSHQVFSVLYPKYGLGFPIPPYPHSLKIATFAPLAARLADMKI
jgi:hypothetical protein